MTPERVADQIAERCRCGVILDAFCGVGGNAIAFARTCERGTASRFNVQNPDSRLYFYLDPPVIALDTSPVRLALARHNAVIYGVEDRIEFILGDFIAFSRSLELQKSTSEGLKQRKIDVIFLSPPWGGPSYLSSTGSDATTKDPGSAEEYGEYSLSNIRPIHGAELFALTRKLTLNIAYFLPRNVSLKEVSKLVQDDDAEETEMIEVEEEWMGSKLKALTCYFGGLVEGQEHLFSDGPRKQK